MHLKVITLIVAVFHLGISVAQTVVLSVVLTVVLTMVAVYGADCGVESCGGASGCHCT